MNRTLLFFIVVCLLIFAGTGAVLLTADHTVDHNIPGKSTGAGRNSIFSVEQ